MATISFPSDDSILPYIVADTGGFVKEIGGLFTIRLRMICGEVKNYTEVTKKEGIYSLGDEGPIPKRPYEKMLSRIV